MIEPWKKSRTPELKRLLKSFNEHTPSNPDDDNDLSCEDFRSATDPKSAELLDKIEAVGRIVLFDSAGRKQGQSRAALNRAGTPVSVVGDPYNADDMYKTTLQIQTEHGNITISAPRVDR